MLTGLRIYVDMLTC